MNCPYCDKDIKNVDLLKEVLGCIEPKWFRASARVVICDGCNEKVLARNHWFIKLGYLLHAIALMLLIPFDRFFNITWQFGLTFLIVGFVFLTYVDRLKKKPTLEKYQS